jgi:hypothetical protein
MTEAFLAYERRQAANLGMTLMQPINLQSKLD